MQLHLDPIGGMAGDMFIAALLDAFPDHEEGVRGGIAAVCGLETGVECQLLSHNDGVLQGSRFVVRGPGGSPGTRGPGDVMSGCRAEPAAADAQLHIAPRCHHVSWKQIRADLEQAGLAEEVKRHTVAIFSLLAEAEGRVHGIAPADVAFHEIGAWDSIADIVGAAHLIAAFGATRWTVGPVPLGGGHIRTAHGIMPVPAPAAAFLLEGFATVDDGLPGERITPTGAAILRYLCANVSPPSQPRVLKRSGIGFGMRQLPGLSNCLRVLSFEEQAALGAGHRELSVIEFEVDDQSGEDLAIALEHLRAHQAVFDVVQAPVFGKKGRMMTHVRLLLNPSCLEEVIVACFRETTTIGLRHHTVDSATLRRHLDAVEIDQQNVRVKTAERPDGRTAKAEADDLFVMESHAARSQLRREAERLALASERIE